MGVWWGCAVGGGDAAGRRRRVKIGSACALRSGPGRTHAYVTAGRTHPAARARVGPPPTRPASPEGGSPPRQARTAPPTCLRWAGPGQRVRVGGQRVRVGGGRGTGRPSPHNQAGSPQGARRPVQPPHPPHPPPASSSSSDDSAGSASVPPRGCWLGGRVWGSRGPSAPPTRWPKTLGAKRRPEAAEPRRGGGRAGVRGTTAPGPKAASSPAAGTCTTRLTPGCQATMAICFWMASTSGAASAPPSRYENATTPSASGDFCLVQSCKEWGSG